MQKFRNFTYTPFIWQSCERLAAFNACRTDQYPQHIVFLQRLSEEVDDLAKCTTGLESTEYLAAKSLDLKNRLDSFKASLTFPLSLCRMCFKSLAE